MEKEIVCERSNDDDYVYDIYYTNSQQFDFRLFERDLTFEALGQDVTFHNRAGDDECVYGDDDDDENDESNWRNDYPDADPLYIEAGEGNYNYDNGMTKSFRMSCKDGLNLRYSCKKNENAHHKYCTILCSTYVLHIISYKLLVKRKLNRRISKFPLFLRLKSLVRATQ